MKKGVLGRLLAVCMLTGALVFQPLAASAKNGDIVGNLYSTDILAYVNGKPVASYNIGGKTAVIMEDLNGFSGSGDNNDWYGYGIDCWYHDGTRTLNVNSRHESYGSPVVKRGAPGGAVVGHIYETDIRVLFNNHLVPAYNINGKTAVCIEDLGTVTENSPNAAYGYSEYMCKFRWDPEAREVWLDTWHSMDSRDMRNVPLHKLLFELNDDVLTVTYDQLNRYQNTLSIETSEAFLQDTYRIKPFYLDGREVGTLFVDAKGATWCNADLETLCELLKDRCVVFSYDEAVDYVTTGYTVIERRDLETASVFLAEKDGGKYLFYAMKKGDLILEWQTLEADTYDIVKIVDEEDGMYLYVYPFAGPHGATGMMQPIQPEIYGD